MAKVGAFGPDCTTEQVRLAVGEDTGVQHSFGSIYTTMQRLMADGIIVSTKSDKSARRGGRRRRLYSLTAAGAEQLERIVKVNRTVFGASSAFGPDVGP